MKSRVGIWQGFDTIKKPPQEPKTQYQWTFKKMHFSRARDSCKRGGPHGLAAWWAFWIWTRPSCRGEWNVKEIVHVAAVEMSRRDAYSYLHLRNVMKTQSESVENQFRFCFITFLKWIYVHSFFLQNAPWSTCSTHAYTCSLYQNIELSVSTTSNIFCVRLCMDYTVPLISKSTLCVSWNPLEGLV